MEQQRSNEAPRMVFTLTDDEEQALDKAYGVVLHDRRAGSAYIGEHIFLDGEAGAYEVIVENIQRPRSGMETDADFVVSLLRAPRNRK